MTLFGVQLSDLSSTIVLISAVIIAIKNIYDFFIRKPGTKISGDIYKKETEHIESIINEKVPPLVSEQLEEVTNQLQELKQLAIDHKDKLDGIDTNIDLLMDSQKDLMRAQLNNIYYKYLHYGRILDYDKKAFLKIYEDYSAMGGNSWIQTLHEEVKDWPAVHNEVDL